MSVIPYLAAALIVWIATPVTAQLSGPTLVKDINASPSGFGARNVGSGDGVAYFAGNDGVNGFELWKSDGTAAGTVLVKDINPGTASSEPNRFVHGNGITFFLASDAAHGRELWRTDGTAAGTMIVKDIFPGTGSGPSPDETYGTSMAFINGLLFFDATPTNNNIEAWRSDGTEAGTFMLKDINTSPGFSYPPTGFTGLGNLTYFAVSGAIWRTDGTTDGTLRVAEVPTTGEYPMPIVIGELNGELLFGVASGPGGATTGALWKTNGSGPGTMEVTNFPNHSAPIGLSRTAAVAGDKVLFYARDANGMQLWRSNGTTAATTPIKVFAVQPKYFTAVGSNVYFGGAESGAADELWRSDGTPGGTVRVTTTRPSNQLVAFGARLAFVSGSGPDAKLYLTDGTTPGTTALVSSQAGTPAVVGNTLFFTASDPLHATELWKSDGTVGGTSLVRDVFVGTGDAAPSIFTELNGMLFFAATSGETGAELWRSDGTTAGTQLVRDINPGTASSGASQLTVVGTRVFFAANEPIAGSELWVTEGTEQSTRPVTDIALFTFPRFLTAVDDRLFYTRNEQQGTGEELYVSDGTAGGTHMVKDIRPGMGSSIISNQNYTSQFIAYKGLLFFTATDGQNGIQLWKSDGTEQGTVMVIALPHRIDLYGPLRLVVLDDFLYFTADVQTNPVVGAEIFRTDGTEAGTIRPFGAGNGPFPAGELVAARGALYFPGLMRSGPVQTIQLYKTDGTPPGTTLVRQINPNGNAFSTSQAAQITEAGDYVFFVADDGTHGFELWRTDGTSDGTIMMGESVTSPSLAIRMLTAYGDLLAFTVNDGKLWLSDGTPAGTGPLAASVGLFPTLFKTIGSRLFIASSGGLIGSELYLLRQGVEATPTAPATPTHSLPPPTQTPTRTPTGPIINPSATPTQATTPTRTNTSLVMTPTTTVAGGTATPTATVGTGCTGDCDGGGSVTVDEIVRGVNIALGTANIDMCRAFDSNGDSQVTVDEIVAAVSRALNGC